MGIAVKRVKCAPVIGQCGPTVGRPVHLHQANRGRTAIVAIVIVKGEPVGAVVIHDGRMAGTDVARSAFEHHRAAAIGQVNAVPVIIRAGDARAAADTNVVGAIRAGTAAAEIHKQIVIAAVLVKARAFLGIAEKYRAIVGNPVDRGTGREAFTRDRIQLHDENAVRI